MRMMGCASVVTVDYDLDDELIVYADVFERYLRSRAEKLGATAVYCKRSPSGKGLHCVVCFPQELDEYERLALEAALLDDPVRILYNLKRLARRGRLVDILFQVKRKLWDAL